MNLTTRCRDRLAGPFHGLIHGLILGLLFAVPAPVWSQSCSLSMGWETWEPYQVPSEVGDPGGLDIELIQAIAREMACELVLVNMPWSRLLEEVRRGGIDMAPGASFSQDRNQWAYFSDAYRNETARMFVLSWKVDQYRLASLGDIVAMDFQLGVTEGWYHGEEFANLLRSNRAFQARVQSVRKDELNYEKLLRGRIDGFIGDEFSTLHTLRKQDVFNRVAVHPLDIHQSEIYVMFSRRSTSPAIVERFNQGIRTIRESGEMAEIMQRYLDAG